MTWLSLPAEAIRAASDSVGAANPAKAAETAVNRATHETAVATLLRTFVHDRAIKASSALGLR